MQMDQDGEKPKPNCGFQYRDLNFTEEQYERALKQIGQPESEVSANQLLAALIDISNHDSNHNEPTKGVTSADINQSSNQPINQAQTELNLTDASAIAATSSSLQVTDLSNWAVDSVVSDQQAVSSSSATSCYSSFTGFPSSSASDQSLDNQPLRQQSKPETSLRKIYIDGANVAKTHGKNVIFSWQGIKFCVDWFVKRHHKVKVVVPIDKCNPRNSDDELTISYLDQLDALIKTPQPCNDDMFLIQAALQNKGIIVSNDQFRYETQDNDEMRDFVFANRLPYIFDDDLFIPARDPLGRSAPKLDEFLHRSCDVPYTSNTSSYYRRTVCRTKSQQPRYQRSTLQPTHSLPIVESSHSQRLTMGVGLPFYSTNTPEKNNKPPAQQFNSNDLQPSFSGHRRAAVYRKSTKLQNI